MGVRVPSILRDALPPAANFNQAMGFAKLLGRPTKALASIGILDDAYPERYVTVRRLLTGAWTQRSCMIPTEHRVQPRLPNSFLAFLLLFFFLFVAYHIWRFMMGGCP